jgi:hypothetical protein
MIPLTRSLALVVAAGSLLVGPSAAHAATNWCNNEASDIWTGLVGADISPDPGFGICLGDQGYWIVPNLNNVEVRKCSFTNGLPPTCTDLAAVSYTTFSLTCVYGLKIDVDGFILGPFDVGVC